jgi:plastocyanin
MQRFTLPLSVLAAGLVLVACGGGASPAPATSAASQPAASAPASGGGAACEEAPAGSAATVEVTIKDFSYDPEPVTAAVGDVIAWTNEDSAPHTASLTDGSCGTDNLNQGATGALVFNEPGTYEYQCNVHPTQMAGFTIEIQ